MYSSGQNMNQTKLYYCLLTLAGALARTLPLDASEISPELDIARKLNHAFIQVADKVSPAVVVIRVKQKVVQEDSDQEGNRFFEFFPREFRRRLEEQFDKERKEHSRPNRQPEFDGQGSGVVIREDGYILTNRHVVENAEEIEVRFKDGNRYTAKVRGVDLQSDIAVIKVDAKDRRLPAAKLGDSSKTRVGEFAIAIGAPFELDYSVTFGHVSAKGRRVVSEMVMMDQDFLQTDASINPGNSGGPLVNIEGEVIGINTMIRGMRTGIGFAVPINLAKEVSEKLIADGKFTRAWLGIIIETLSEDKDLQKWVEGVENGIFVKSILPGGPSARSTLEPGDVITAVDGKPVLTVPELKSEIRVKEVGESVILDVVREGKTIKIKVKPGQFPEDNFALRKPTKQEENESKNFGITAKALTSELADDYGVEKIDGVIVTAVEPGSLAEGRRIKAGDIITNVNRKKVATLKEFREAMKDADAKKGVSIVVVTEAGRRIDFLKESGD
jgi:serine protease Do